MGGNSQAQCACSLRKKPGNSGQVCDRTDKTFNNRYCAHSEVAMARYYFHLRTGSIVTRDEEGTDLPDLSAAQHEAQLSARELVSDAIMAGKRYIPEVFVIANETGRELATFSLAAVLPKP